MTPDQTEHLAALLRAKRQELGISAREVARRAGVDVGTVSVTERGLNPRPKPDILRAIGGVLGIPAADLYTMVNWLPEAELPTLRSYMRAKYHDLPEEAVDEVERFIARLEKKHRTGPMNGEDEH